MMLQIKSVELRHLRMPLLEPFKTSYGEEKVKEVILVFVVTEESVGVGECVALSKPLYTPETHETAWHILSEFIIPNILGKEIDHPRRIREWLLPIRGHNMAKSSIETAVWDAYAKALSVPLYRLIGGVKKEIEVGISIGIQPTIKDLLNKIAKYLQQGYKRVKVKISPGHDLEVLNAIRREFGDIPLMADANSAYSLSDIPLFQKMDAVQLMMIEQPLGYDDILDHAKLQSAINTPVCLDESLHSLSDLKKALEIGSCKIVNLKLGRVGGISEALDIEELCLANKIPLWCGGMLESGIGRMANLAISSLAGFTLPGDTGPSNRYFAKDIIEPPVSFLRKGVLSLSESPGIGAKINETIMDEYTVQRKYF